ncbi:MAG: DNA-3-methyladenine glycosylase [Ornithinimicrobium sp.]
MSDTTLWERDALTGSPVEVAPRLLGAVISHNGVAVRITEVEAYGGSDDPGSHAFRGPTPRSQIMFGEAGRAYVYFSYGMHHCLNIVCGPTGSAGAILLRGGEVIQGEASARRRRDKARSVPHPYRDLARGPARLASAVDVDLNSNGVDVCDPDCSLGLLAGHPVDPASVSTGPRVGVRGPGGDASTYPWRFWVSADPTVSTYRPAVRR